MSLLLCLTVILGVVPSCDPLPRPALGSAGEVGLVGVRDEDDSRLAMIRDLLEVEVSMIQGEPAFRLTVIPSSAKRNWKAHLLLCDLGDPGDARLVTDLMGRKERDELAGLAAGHRFYRDVWASGQVVLLLHARDAASLRRHLEDRGGAIFRGLSDHLIDALRDGLYAGGEQEKLGESVERAHQFRIRVPHGYLMEEREREVVVKRIVPEEPKRWLLIHYGPADRAPVDPEGWVALRDSLLSSSRSGDLVLREQTEIRRHNFQGRPCIFLEGIWQNEPHMIGGPFRSYGFVEGERYYLIDLTIYHPPAPKLPSMRQLMAIAGTFAG